MANRRLNFLIPTLGLIIGIIFVEFSNSLIFPTIILLCGLGFYAYLIRIGRDVSKNLKINSLYLVSFLFIFISIGWTDGIINRPAILKKSELENIKYIEACVIDIQSLTSGDRIVADIKKVYDSSGKSKKIRNFKAILNSDGLLVNKGDRIFSAVKFSLITPNKNYRNQSYFNHLKNKGIFYSSNISSDNFSIVGQDYNIRTLAANIRNKIEIKIEKSSLSRNTKDFIISILLGGRSFLSSSSRELFQNAGVAHIMAISGLHIGILLAIITTCLLPLGFFFNKKWRILSALLIMWIFIFITGLPTSAVRAGIMATFAGIAIFFHKINRPENALLASMFFILLISPFSIYDIGFQLSVVCVAALLVFTEILNPIDRHSHPFIYNIFSFILVSFIATFASWTLISYYFQKVPLMFLPANIVILPLLPFFIIIALIFIFALFLDVEFSTLRLILDLAHENLSKFLSIFTEKGEYSILYQATPMIIILWFLGIILIALYLYNKKKRKISGIVGSFCLLMCFVIPILFEQEEKGVIFQKKYNEMSIGLYNGNRWEENRFPQGKISVVSNKDFIIFCLDSIPGEAFYKYSDTIQDHRKKFVLIGKGFNFIKQEELSLFKNFEKIIFHSSIIKSREEKLLEIFRSSGLNNIYSLRREGPLELSL